MLGGGPRAGPGLGGEIILYLRTGRGMLWDLQPELVDATRVGFPAKTATLVAQFRMSG